MMQLRMFWYAYLTLEYFCIPNKHFSLNIVLEGKITENHVHNHLHRKVQLPLSHLAAKTEYSLGIISPINVLHFVRIPEMPT